MKMVTSRIWNRLLDENLDKLLQIPLKDSHDFEELLDILEETSNRVIKL